MLTANDITVHLGGKTIVSDVSLQAGEGDWLMLLGPNGAGKSTLLSAISGVIPYEGQVLVNGAELSRMKIRQRAERIGMLNQNNPVNTAFTVEQIVSMGRYSHRQGIFGADEKGLSDRVAAALNETGMTMMAKRSMLSLSGGERQRAFLAQVLCQDPDILLLDEPGNHLDLVYQKEIFLLIDDWRKHSGKTVVSVVHDLSLARMFGTHALLLDEGRCVAQGNIRDVLTDKTLDPVFRMDVRAWREALNKAWDE